MNKDAGGEYLPSVVVVVVENSLGCCGASSPVLVRP
jgi:hypothetical protein